MQLSRANSFQGSLLCVGSDAAYALPTRVDQRARLLSDPETAGSFACAGGGLGGSGAAVARTTLEAGDVVQVWTPGGRGGAARLTAPLS